MKYVGFSLALALCCAAKVAAAEEPEARTAEAESRATAGSDRELARQLFSAGIAVARAGRYEAAKSLFLEAYAASPHYLVLYNIAQAELRLGERGAALNHLRQFLQEGGAAISAEKRAESEAEIARLQPDAAQTPPPSVATTDAPGGASVGSDAAPAPPDSSGAPSGSLAREGRPRSTPVLAEQPSSESANAVRAPTWAYAAIAGGLLTLGGSAAVYVWNDGRYQHWRQENEALDLLKRQSLANGIIPSEDTTLSVRAHQNDQRLARVKELDPVPIVVGAAGLAAMGFGLWKLIDDSDSQILNASADLSGFEIAARLDW